MNSLDTFSAQLKLDIAYLQSNQKEHFAHTTLDKASMILQQKNDYKPVKQTDSKLYGEYKALIKQLRTAKLPFRAIDVIKDMIKKEGRVFRIPETFSSHIPKELLDNTLSKTERKQLVRALEQTLLNQAKAVESAATLAERTCWLHGSNSALLPLLRYTDHTLTPTGILLNKGLAPMSGEISGGGMAPLVGFNQRGISTDTIQGLERCWRYACTDSLSSHFNVETYQDSEGFFKESLNALSRISLDNSRWDATLIDMTRLKQWQPEEFKRLCQLHAEKITALKTDVYSSSSLCETKALQLLNTSHEELQEYARTKNEDFVKRYNLNDDWSEKNMDSYGLDQLPSQFMGHGTTWRHNHNIIIHMKLFGKEFLDDLKLQLIDKPADWKKWEKLDEKLDDVLLWNKLTRKCGDNLEINTIIDKFIRDKLENTIKNNNRLIQNRLDRLERLFDGTTKVELSEQERQMILQPFPILFGSTSKKANQNSSEYTIKEARLGVDIDQIYVKSENMAQMQNYLKENNLDNIVSLMDASLVEQMQSLPRVAAPYQVVKQSPYLNSQDQQDLNRNLLNLVVPLYSAPYPSGGSRDHHGVLHAVRSMLFSQVIMEMYRAEGHTIATPKGDLQLATALHDNARENDGVDLWDKESGEKCTEIFAQKLLRSSEEAAAAGKWIAEKDSKQPTSLEQKIVHESDCVEIMRCLRNMKDFKSDELWITKDLNDQELVNDMVNEARQFIALTESPMIKDFINRSPEPYACLIQILRVANRFSILETYLFEATKTFCDSSSKHHLTEQIEKEIQGYFK